MSSPTPIRTPTPLEWLGTILALLALAGCLAWYMGRVGERTTLAPQARPAFRPDLR